MSDWRDEARELLPRIDPFFDDVLIEDRREGAEAIHGTGDWLGMAGPTMGSALPGGRPGRAGVLIDESRVRQVYPAADGDLLRMICLGVVLHEAVHCVEFGRAAVAEGHPLGSRIVAILSEAIRDGVFTLSPEQPAEKPWADHGATFHRLLLHVYSRANRLGAGVWMTWMFGFQKYELTSGLEYLDALDGEPERLAHLSLFDIRDVPPPVAFCDLWRQDTGEEIPMRRDPSEQLTVPQKRHPCNCTFCPAAPTNIGKPYAKANGMTYLKCRRCGWTWTMDSKQHEAAMAATPAPVAEVTL